MNVEFAYMVSKILRISVGSLWTLQLYNLSSFCCTIIVFNSRSVKKKQNMATQQKREENQEYHSHLYIFCLYSILLKHSIREKF